MVPLGGALGDGVVRQCAFVSVLGIGTNVACVTGLLEGINVIIYLEGVKRCLSHK